MSLRKPVITLYNDTGLTMVDMKDPNTHNVGISEHTMVTMACGLASQGLRVVCHAVTPHYLRAWEAIRTLMVPGKYDVALVGSGEGNDYSSLGHSHQMESNEMWMLCRAIKLTYYLPTNRQELRRVLGFTGPRFIQVRKGIA